MKSTKYTIKFKRKRQGKTNYKKRLELLKGRTDRLVIRRTNTQIIMQVVSYAVDGDKVLLTIHSRELEKHGWKHSYKNTPAAYLAGLLTAKKAKTLKIETVIVDLGLQTPLKGSKIFAALKGAIDGGLNISANEKIFPTEARIKGEHISNYSEKHKSVVADFEKIKKELTK